MAGVAASGRPCPHRRLQAAVVRDAAFKWLADHRKGGFWYPLVAETADFLLNDMPGQHVTEIGRAHV